VTDEEQRALDYCREQRARAEYERRNCKVLAGSADAQRTLCRNWKPILSLVKEQRYGKQEG
jgi:hypothetical protein